MCIVYYYYFVALTSGQWRPLDICQMQRRVIPLTLSFDYCCKQAWLEVTLIIRCIYGISADSRHDSLRIDIT